MKMRVEMSFEVELPRVLEYLRDVNWGDEDVGLTLAGALIDEGTKYEPATLVVSRFLEPKFDLEILKPQIDNVEIL